MGGQNNHDGNDAVVMIFMPAFFTFIRLEKAVCS